MSLLHLRRKEPMRYYSTRGQPNDTRRFCEILLEGLAPDGGLYVPVSYPQVDAKTLAHWRDLSYADLAFEIFSLYIDDIPTDDLRNLCRQTYTEAVFGTPEIAPLYRLEPRLFIQELSNGPSLAFKDIAMQFLGHVFEYELTRKQTCLNILGATSGDTGSAAEYAMRGKRGVRVFMTSPKGRMSPFQQAQMFSLQDENIHNLSIEGVFDDCQDLVKAVSNDLEFKHRFHIGTVNSINWARLLAQVVYYFAGYFAATRKERADQPVDFVVPCGNFGNICAGHIARSMGLPIRALIVATNENDVLHEFFRTGIYRVRTSAQTFETSSPSMDISKASNFERFIFDVVSHNSEDLKNLFVTQLNQTGAFDLSNNTHYQQIFKTFGFLSGRSTHADRLQTIAHTFKQYQRLIDPHTADAMKVGLCHFKAQYPMVILETALPTKFEKTMQEALGFIPERPAHLIGLEDLPKRFTILPADVAKLKTYIQNHCQGDS